MMQNYNPNHYDDHHIYHHDKHHDYIHHHNHSHVHNKRACRVSSNPSISHNIPPSSSAWHHPKLTQTHHSFRGPSCSDVHGGEVGAFGTGGCSANCNCDARYQDPTIGVCDQTESCPDAFSNGECSTDADCAAGYACSGGKGSFSGCQQTGGLGLCVLVNGCTSTYNPSKKMARDVLGMDVDML